MRPTNSWEINCRILSRTAGVHTTCGWFMFIFAFLGVDRFSSATGDGFVLWI